MKVLIISLTYLEDEFYKTLYELQNITWNSIHVDGVETFFLIGNCEKNKIEHDIIYTTCKEDMSCGAKTVKCFEMLKEVEFDFIFRTNASSYVDKKKLKEYISKNCDEDTYCGIIGDYGGIPFVSGSGIIISKKNCDLIANNLDKWDYSYIEDVSLGKLANSINIKAKFGSRQDVQNVTDIVDNMQYHYRLKTYNHNREVEEPILFEKIHNSKLIQ